MTPLVPLAVDSRSLDSLRSQASRDPQQAIRQAAGQFEALFMRQLLKSMRDAMPKSGMWDSPSQSMYTDMFDQQIAQVMSNRPGGLAEVIARQLSRHVKGAVQQPAPDAQGEGEGPATPVAPGGIAAPPGPAAVSRARLGETAVMPAVAETGPVVKSSMPDLRRLSASQADFVRRMWPSAVLAQQSTGVPAEFIVGQAALESGWGRHEIRRADGAASFNLFGIKAGTAWRGDTVDATTTEYIDGKARKQLERFRAYGSYAEAFRDWATVIAGSPRYAQVLRAGATAEGFAGGMQRAGYATDPSYGAKLERTINQTLMLKRLVI